MRYQAPYGSNNPNAGYINGDVSAGIPGSVPPAAAFEQYQRELDALIRNSKLTPTDPKTAGPDDPIGTSLEQVTQAVRSQSLNYFRAENTDPGTQNAVFITMLPPPGALTAGLLVRILIAQANTGPATIGVNGVGTFPALRCDGAALSANDLLAGMMADFIFDGTNFQLANFRGVSSGSIVTNSFGTFIPYVADTSPVSNTITAAFVPPLTAHTNGKPILVKLANTVTDQTTIFINALDAKVIKKFDGSDFDIADCVAGEILLLIYDGTYYQLMNDTPPRQRLFLPFYPEVTFPSTAAMIVNPATGTVTVDISQKFVWRGTVEFYTSAFPIGERQLTTLPSKTYHLRWHAPGTGDASNIITYPRGHFMLKDATDSVYNPAKLKEDDKKFDSHYDDMLVARVVTNASNVPTVTALENRIKLTKFVQRLTEKNVWDVAWGGIGASDPVTLNWSRIPRTFNVRYGNMLREYDAQIHRIKSGDFPCLEAFGMIQDLSHARDGKMVATRYSTWAMVYGTPDDGSLTSLSTELLLPYDCTIEA
jgi:hypothetical protein